MNTDRARLEDRVTIATPEGVELQLLVAGIGSRFMARLLDSLLQVGIIVALFVAIGFANSLVGGFGVAAGIILVFVVIFCYDVFFELAFAGRTPGKMASGIRVVGASGRPVSPGPSAIRNLVRIIDFLPMFYGIGIVSMLATQHTQRLGDLAGETLVIRDRRGDDREMSLEGAGLRTTVPVEAVAEWDVSAVTAGELDAVRQFLARRLALPPEVRYRFSVELATRLAAKVTGVPPRAHPEYVLEGVVVAKDARS